MNKKHIPIFAAADERYLPYLAVTVKSISNHCSEEYIYDIKILSVGLPKESADTILCGCAPNVTLEIVDVDSRIFDIREELHLRLRDYYSEAIYYRLFIPSMFPELERAVYIDCDIVLVDDIAKLYFTDIGDNILGVVPDESIPGVPAFCEYIDKWVGVPKGKYFNSGVLLMDLDRMRRERIEEKFLYLLRKYNFDTVAPDQDYLNFLCRDRVHYLDYGWNKQPDKNFTPPVSKLHLIHFNMFNKPWHYVDVPYEEQFWEVADTTCFASMLRRGLMDYTDADREQDREGSLKLVESAARLATENGGFNEAVPADFHNIFDTLVMTV